MNRNKFIEILNILQGFKSAVKNCHWAETSSSNKHKILDDIYYELDRYSDAFAEEGSMCYGLIKHGEIKPVEVKYFDGSELVGTISKFAIKVRELLKKTEDKVFLSGLCSLTDEFVHAIHISHYRYKMN